MYETNRHNGNAIYSVTVGEKQNLAVPPEKNTPSVPSITERSVCNPKPPTADTEAMLNTVTARDKQNLAVPPERNTPSVPSITERGGCNPKPPTADTEAMLNTVAATFSKILPKLKKPIKPTK